VKLGDVSQQAGQMDAAREFYQQYLDIAKKLAAADPANAEAQRDLSVSYQRMGDVSQQAGRLDAAREFYQQYLDIAKKLAAADPTNAQAQRDLWVSCIKLAASRRDIDGVAQAAEALRNLEPKTPANLYNAACGYGLCAKLAAGWPGHGPFPPPNGAAKAKGPDVKSAEKSEQKYIHAAIDLLQSAMKAGFKTISWMQRDPDLAALRELPEFKKLLSSAR